ncbi:MAG: DUF7226 domain-containing protein [bacterium]
MEPIFPQANDISKIIQIVKMDENELNDNTLCDSLRFSAQRQAHYYIIASKYLDILDGNRKFTEFGKKLKSSENKQLQYRLIQKIISKPVFGDVFLDQYFNNKQYDKDEIAQLILFYTDIEKVSVADRRATTVLSWLKWIESFKN